MRNALCLSFSMLALATLAACSRTPDQPAISEDLKQDLAKVGGGDVQLASASAPRLDIMSASERGLSATPAPKSPAVAKAPSALSATLSRWPAPWVAAK